MTASPGADWAWVVAIIGRTPDSPDQLVVAPVVGDSEQATETDLLLSPEILGYNGFVEVANLGTILEDQLSEPLGELLAPARHALSALYRSLLGSGDPPAPQWLGLPVESEDDPRLLSAEERSESLRSLWRRAHARVDDPSEPPVHLPTPESVGTLVSAHLTAGEWDRPSLLEASGADGKHLTSFLSDRLDLTDKRDIADLARVLHCLDLPWEVAEPAVRLSLLGSPGGSRHATGPSLPIAARSQPGTSDADITADLFADQSSIDDSIQARKQQVDLYVAELRRELDALE